MGSLVQSVENERGLTLVEAAISMALIGMVVFSFFALVTTAVKGWGGVEGQLDVQQNPRVAANRIVSEARQSRDYVIDSTNTNLGLVKVTILTASAAAGATSITVENAAMLVVNEPIVLLNLNRLEQVTATAISGTTVTVSPALARPHKQGQPVRRAQSTVSTAVTAPSTTVTVAEGMVFQVGDPIAVENEGPVTITAISTNTLTVTPSLSTNHAIGEVVQPLSVVFTLSGTQLTRCTSSCNVSANQIPLADLLAVPSGKQLFTVVKTTLASAMSAGDTSVCVASVSGFSVNDRIQIGRETYGTRAVTMADRHTVTAINTGTNCMTLDTHDGVKFAHATGSLVRVNAVDINLQSTQFNTVTQQTQQVSTGTKAQMRN